MSVCLWVWKSMSYSHIHITYILDICKFNGRSCLVTFWPLKFFLPTLMAGVPDPEALWSSHHYSGPHLWAECSVTKHNQRLLLDSHRPGGPWWLQVFEEYPHEFADPVVSSSLVFNSHKWIHYKFWMWWSYLQVDGGNMSIFNCCVWFLFASPDKTWAWQAK